MNCSNPFKELRVPGHTCDGAAVTKRKYWRFGDKTKSEPTIVDEVHHLCQKCANQWDDVQAEGEAEARAS